MIIENTENPLATLTDLRQRFDQMSALNKRILDAALVLFSEKGFAATTASIAKQAATTEKTLFKHFDSKEKLFTEVLSMTMIKLLDPELLHQLSNQNLSINTDPFTFFREMTARQLLNFAETPHLFKFALQEMIMNPTFRKMVMTFVHQTLLPVAERVIETGQQNGKIRQLPKGMIIRFLFMNFMGHVITQTIFRSDNQTNDNDSLDQLMQVVLLGIREK